ncbi:MAG: heparinase II/III family protein [Proteobacteria bacterium]|nr:heparinase II/III family protein [Pseudomonadota bacterium]
MKNLIWHIKRLQKMPPMEIPYRIIHKLREMTDRHMAFDFRFSTSSFHHRLLKLSSYLSKEDVETPVTIISRADSILENRFIIFGIDKDYGDRIDWHLDPKTHKRWPVKFWGDIDHRDSSHLGGVKFVWEINRLDFLPTLGLAYFLTGNQPYADKILDIVREWQKENPYPNGVNWISGIEMGLRVANLVWAISYLSAYDFKETDYEILNRFMYFHGRHLYRYPSKYSSNNNHTLAEALGLFLVGFYFPHLKGSEKWFDFGKHVLEREVERQILPDGGSFEYTTTYLSFVIDFFLLFKIVCDQNHVSYSQMINERLKKSAEFISALMDDQGHLPNIGDQDSAVLVNFGLNNWENFTSFLNTAAVLFNRTDLIKTHFPDIKTLLLLGKKTVFQMDGKIRTENEEPIFKTTAKQFKESGLAVIHDIQGNKTIHFVGNATKLGMPPLYAHGHLDALSFYLTIDGLEIFVDPGTYLYHGAREWRYYFRSTVAHNTIRINQEDFTPQISDFMFDRPYHILENNLETRANRIVWTASHDAYHQLKPSVAHTRKVIYDKHTSAFNIQDDLRSDGSYFAEQFFHLHPECHVSIEKHNVNIRREHLHVRLDADQKLQVDCFRGNKKPMMGWFSKAFNHVVAADTLVLSGNFDNNTTLTTHIYLNTIYEET